MTLTQALTTIFEILAVITLFWCFFNEDRLIAFERRLFAGARRRRLRVVNSNQNSFTTVNRVR